MTNEELLEEKRLKDRFNKIIELFNYKYVKANTKSKKELIARDLFSIADICEKYFPQFKFDISWNKDIELYNQGILSCYKFIDNIIINKDKYFKIFNSSMYNILRLKINDYKYYEKNLPRHKEKELDYIFCSFLNDFDSKTYKEYLNMIDRENIFYTPLLTKNGTNYTFTILSDNMIFLNSLYKSNINFYETLAHELGHSLEAKLYLNSGKEREFNSTMNSPFYEVPSSFMQYAYINYLIENNIYKEEAEIILYDYYMELLVNTMYSNIICQISNIESKLDENMNIKLETYGKYLDKLKIDYNLYSIPIYKKISLIVPFIYGFGQLFSIYLYENYKKDPICFKKEFSKSLLEYSQTEDMSSFESVGINYDELVKGDTLKKVLTRNS